MIVGSVSLITLFQDRERSGESVRETEADEEVRKREDERETEKTERDRRMGR